MPQHSESASDAHVDDVELNLGACHYGDFGEDATIIARAPDGVGWVPVCEQHRQRALDEGYVVMPGHAS